ncbi:hypothetical protein NC652_030420 [Populus alba x Populus x berolinensis]|nr:hypothetical protein NC652_030420 [Populus alba x Populus x berolinensis]
MTNHTELVSWPSLEALFICFRQKLSSFRFYISNLIDMYISGLMDRCRCTLLSYQVDVKRSMEDGENVSTNFPREI